MSYFRTIVRSLAFALLLSAPATGCVEATDELAAEQDQDLTQGHSIKFVTLNVTKAQAKPGVTVLKSKSEYQSFFASKPPQGVDFNKHWVVHYSTGVHNTGGYAAKIGTITRKGFGQKKKLVVHTESTEPGPLCAVTMAFTNPQMTVRINKQPGTPYVGEDNIHEVTDCSKPNFCQLAKCGAGYVCDELQDNCVPADPCSPSPCAADEWCTVVFPQCVQPENFPGPVCNPKAVCLATCKSNADCLAGETCQPAAVCITTPCDFPSVCR
jgi:hypothetical protein